MPPASEASGHIHPSQRKKGGIIRTNARRRPDRGMGARGASPPGRTTGEHSTPPLVGGPFLPSRESPLRRGRRFPVAKEDEQNNCCFRLHKGPTNGRHRQGRSTPEGNGTEFDGTSS